jgi:hypothetical protein
LLGGEIEQHQTLIALRRRSAAIERILLKKSFSLNSHNISAP